MQCEHIQELILTDHMDGEMGDAQKKQVEQHLEACARCREYAALARQAAIEPFENADRVHPPEYVWDRIKARIEEEQDSAKGIGVFGYIRNIFTIPKPVYALSAVMLILIVVLLVFSIPMTTRKPNTAFFKYKMKAVLVTINNFRKASITTFFPWRKDQNTGFSKSLKRNPVPPSSLFLRKGGILTSSLSLIEKRSITKMSLFDPNGTQLANGISEEIDIYVYLTDWDPVTEFDVAFGTDTEEYFL